jgi:hypothetical protein
MMFTWHIFRSQLQTCIVDEGSHLYVSYDLTAVHSQLPSCYHQAIIAIPGDEHVTLNLNQVQLTMPKPQLALPHMMNNGKTPDEQLYCLILCDSDCPAMVPFHQLNFLDFAGREFLLKPDLVTKKKQIV